MSLVVRLKDGSMFQCYPPDLRGSRYPSEEVWLVAVREQMNLERKKRGKLLHLAKKNAQAAATEIRGMRSRKVDFTHNEKADTLLHLISTYEQMAEDAKKLFWRADRAKKNLQRALDSLRDPLEGFVEPASGQRIVGEDA